MGVIQLADLRKNQAIQDLILLLASRVGSKLDYQELSRELGVSRSTLREYVAFLQGTYFIELVRPFSRKKDTGIRRAPRVYFCDCGLLRHIAQLEEGKIFENAVFQNLRLLGALHYYQKKSGTGIDFILNEQEACEVKVSVTEFDLRRFQVLAQRLGLRKYRVVASCLFEFCRILPSALR